MIKSDETNNMASHQLLVVISMVVLSVIKCTANNTLNIYISQEKGKDWKGCLEGGVCQSLTYALDAIWQNKRADLAVITLLHDYTLCNETLILYPPNSNLNHLILRSASGMHVTIDMCDSYITMIDYRNQALNNPHFSISIEGIQFHNSTIDSGTLYFQNLKQVNISSCMFLCNRNASLVVIDTDLNITNCTFSGNRCNSDWKLTSSDRILSRGIITSNQLPVERNISITNCMFQDMYIIPPEHEQWTSPSNNWTELTTSGGAILIVLAHKSKHTSVIIDKCTFSNNSAVYGGAVAIMGWQDSHHGKINVRNSLFTKCQGGRAGGSLYFSSVGNRIRQHILTLELCEFENSISGLGGAVGLFLYNEIDIVHMKIFYEIPLFNVISCRFHNNTATQGAAIHATCLSSFDDCGSKYAVYMENVTISNQVRLLLQNDGKLPVAGALFFEMMHCIFNDTVSVSNSMFLSGIALVNAHIHLRGRLILFRNYVDAKGGGIVLSGFSHIIMGRKAHLRIEKNYAWVYGGGIYAMVSLGMLTSHMTNPRCFILNDIDTNSGESNMLPHKQIELIDNGAAIAGGAIFVDTLRHCGSYGDFPFASVKGALIWLKKTVDFSGNYIGSAGGNNRSYIKRDELSPAEISTNTDRFNISTIGVYSAPQMNVEVKIKAFDEINFQSYSSSVMYLVDHGAVLRRYNSSIYLQDDRLVMSRKSGSDSASFHFNLRKNSSLQDAIARNYTVAIIDDRAPNRPITSFYLHPTRCLPGYVFDKITRTCTCDIDNPAIVRCHKGSIFIKPWYWAYVSNDGRLQTYYCPRGHCDCKKEAFTTGCEFDVNFPNKQCKAGFQGALCGGCKPGYAVQLHNMDCVRCNDTTKGKIFLILWLFIFTVVCFAIVIFNPAFPPLMRGALFFSQMIQFVYSRNSNDKIGSILVRILNIATLDGIAPLGCIAKSMDMIKGQLLLYIFPCICFCVLCTIYVGNKLYLINFKKRETPFQSIWILILYVYTTVSQDALMSFYCVRINGPLVFFYDGTQQCFQGYHLAAVLLSAFYMAAFVIPLPVFVFLISTGRIRTVPYIFDAITKGYRVECRWWWTYEFTRRLVFIGVFAFCPILKLKELLLTLSAFACCLFHVAWLPYQQKVANVTETILLAILFFVSYVRSTCCGMSLSLLFLTPAVVFVLGICIYTIVFSIKKRCFTTNKDESLVEEHESDEISITNQSLSTTGNIPHPKRLEDPTDEYI